MTPTLDQTKLQNCNEELRLARDEIHRLKQPKTVGEPPFDRRDIVGMARYMCDEIAGDINDRCSDSNEYARGSIEIATVLMDEVSRLRGAIGKTLDANCHLADGENCTLLSLKVALRESGSPWSGDIIGEENER